MARPGLRFRGMDKRNLEKLVDKALNERVIDKEIVPLADRIAQLYEAEMVKLAPHDKGFLENSSTLKTTRSGNIIRSIIGFGANYAAKVHEFPPAKRGPKTRAKPATKFGAPGPKWVLRVLRGMDYKYHLLRGARKIVKRQ